MRLDHLLSRESSRNDAVDSVHAYRSFLLEAFERKFFKNLEKEVKRSFSFDEKLKGRVVIAFE